MYKNKNKLKGKSLLVTESLTTTHIGLLKEVQGKYGVRNAWTTCVKKTIEYSFTKNMVIK